jgi:hypothetical protein
MFLASALEGISTDLGFWNYAGSAIFGCFFGLIALIGFTILWVKDIRRLRREIATSFDHLTPKTDETAPTR